MKNLLKITGVVALALLVAGCDLLGDKAEEAVVEAGEKAGVDVGVDTVDISALGGAGAITGLTIRNPEGYQTEYAFSMDEVGLNLKVTSILFKPITLSDFVLDSPVVNLEIKGPGQNNLKEIADKFSAAYATDDSEEVAEEETEEEAEEKENEEKELRRIRIEDLRIEGVSFNYYPAEGDGFSGTLPPIHLTDVGGDDGVTAAGLGAIVALAIGGRILVDRLMAELKERLLDEDGFAGRLREFFISINAELPPNLQQAINDYIAALHGILDSAAEEGFRDFEETGSEIAAATEVLAEDIKENLNEEQIRQLVEFLKTERQVIIETAKGMLIEMVQQQLQVRQEQLASTRVIIQDILEQVASLAERIRAGELDKVNWEAEYLALTDRNLPRLAEVLDDTQMESVSLWVNRIDQVIRSRYFAGG